MAAQEPTPPAGEARVPLGGDYWQADPGVPLWGFADTHAHLMAHLAFGGKAFWGQPYDPQARAPGLSSHPAEPGEDGLPGALGSSAPIHGGLGNVNPEFGHVPGGGWPDFGTFPHFTTLVHQQAYLDWLYRAYQGGLRLVSCLAVNNELLASKTNPSVPHDDRSAIATEVAAMKAMCVWLDRQSGGQGQGWLQIAYSPADATRIIGQNKLALILGVEVDSLGNWRRAEDLAQQAGGDAEQARGLIAAELDWLYSLGIRQITPIHLATNAFGGTAIYLRFLELSNVFLTGKAWEVEDAFDTGVRYRLDQDGADLVNEIERRIAGAGPGIQGRPRLSMNRHSLIDTLPGLEDLADKAIAPDVKGGHANVQGLHDFGVMLLEEMMRRGMIIDIDHMSQKAADAALDLAEARDYPVISSHGWYRELTYHADVEFLPQNQPAFGTGDVHKVAHEGTRTAGQLERIARLGGIVAPILNQGDVAGLRRALPDQAHKVPEPCAGSSTSWAQAYLYAVAKMGGRGVAIGSDVNGAAGLPGPRFGTFAAYGANSDAIRIGQRRGEIDRQRNGVRYDRPLRDYRWFRFDESGPGAYDDDDRDVWQAVAEYKAGFDPSHQRHPADDMPNPELLALLEALHQRVDRERIDNMARGLWAVDQAVGDREAVADQGVASWPPEQRAAYLARRAVETRGLLGHLLEHLLGLGPSEAVLFEKIQAVWRKWDDMQGLNPPLVRCTAGPRRDFDINLDGMAHYGMVPDFLQDLRNVGLSAEDLAPLFRSAYDYVQMWGKCVARTQSGSPAAVSVRE